MAPAFIQYLGTGRRKSAIARVFLRPGEGKLVVNGRGVAEYFPSEMARMMVKQPLQAVEMADRFDVLINAHGGGVVGQAGAARLGIARALCVFNPELRGKLKSSGFLRRDPRQHERKKYGQKGARKRFQFSKR
ncbi:MAG: 30S ribosomal protein S9 [Bryobacterales bacterium]|nr:30S ribosomal protein S9 [Bryobacterales bacterium]